MPCFSPLRAFSAGKAENGKQRIVFNVKDAVNPDRPLDLPCGQCIGCRLERSRQWAMRCVHEAECFSQNCFITLTYDDDHLPPDGSLCLSDFQKFLKRLRKRFGKLRFFHCGEYGENLKRPHYHACIFGFDFPDKVFWSERNGNKYYRSAALEELWPLGFSMVGDVTFESAAYVARYILKKVNGDLAKDHYDGKRPEYVTMSRRPGIGKTWFDRFQGDVFPSDEVVFRGFPMRPPKFYDRQFEVIDPKAFELLKSQRLARSKKFSFDRSSSGQVVRVDENSSFRLKDKEVVKKSRITSLVRNLETQEV